MVHRSRLQAQNTEQTNARSQQGSSIPAQSARTQRNEFTAAVLRRPINRAVDMHAMRGSEALLFLSLAALERQFRNARLIEFAQLFLHHAVVLLLGRGRQRQIEAFLFGEIQRNP